MTFIDNLSTKEVAFWHRKVCQVTPWLFVSGDLPSSKNLAIVKLGEWKDNGVTDIIDVRGEWSDEDLVRQCAPEIRYHHLGTHDDGTSQEVSWFEEGVQALHQALAHENSKVMVHCHMGINRGPSMAFAFLLDQGWEPVAALDALRSARPLAGIIYAADAVMAIGHLQHKSSEEVKNQLEMVDEWFERNQIDISTIIRKIRKAS
jgi:protein-tyrosine phosphatase